MPTYIATTTKQTARQALGVATYSYDFNTTTSAGNAGGTTVVCSAYFGDDTDFHKNKWILLTSGTYSGQFRQISAFDGSTGSTGTFTVRNAFGGQVANAVTFELYTFNPILYHRAINQAIQRYHPAIHRPVYNYVLTGWNKDAYKVDFGLPRNMAFIHRILLESAGGVQQADRFDRANSTTTAGNGQYATWTATAGTPGITSEQLYFVTDADGDHVTFDPATEMQDGIIEAAVSGTMISAGNDTWRTPTLTFRIFEDYLGAIDTNNMLLVRLVDSGNSGMTGGAVDLRKVDGGTESSLSEAAVTLANGTVYWPRVEFIGTWIRVWVDDVELITYELTGANLKYLQGVRAGIRLDKAGSPGTVARVDNYRAHALVPYSEINDRGFSSDRRTVRIPAMGRERLPLERWLKIEGTAPLSLLAADTTAGTVASDTTAVLEIATTDDAWQTLLAAAKVELYDILSQVIGPYDGDESDKAKLSAAKQQAQADLGRLLREHSMPLAAPGIRHP